MKRFVLLLVCTAVFVCLLAAPAADAKKTGQPPDVPSAGGHSRYDRGRARGSRTRGATGTPADMAWYQAVDPEGDDGATLARPVQAGPHE